MKRAGYWLALVAMCGLVALYVAGRDLFGFYTGYRQGEREMRELSEQADALAEEKARLQQRIEHIGNDPVEMEAIVRQNKDLVRAGETIYRIELEPN